MWINLHINVMCTDHIEYQISSVSQLISDFVDCWRDLPSIDFDSDELKQQLSIIPGGKAQFPDGIHKNGSICYDAKYSSTGNFNNQLNSNCPKDYIYLKNIPNAVLSTVKNAREKYGRSEDEPIKCYYAFTGTDEKTGLPKGTIIDAEVHSLQPHQINAVNDNFLIHLYQCRYGYSFDEAKDLLKMVNRIVDNSRTGYLKSSKTIKINNTVAARMRIMYHDYTRSALKKHNMEIFEPGYISLVVPSRLEEIYEPYMKSTYFVKQCQKIDLDDSGCITCYKIKIN